MRWAVTSLPNVWGEKTKENYKYNQFSIYWKVKYIRKKRIQQHKKLFGH